MPRKEDKRNSELVKEHLTKAFPEESVYNREEFALLRFMDISALDLEGAKRAIEILMEQNTKLRELLKHHERRDQHERNAQRAELKAILEGVVRSNEMEDDDLDFYLEAVAQGFVCNKTSVSANDSIVTLGTLISTKKETLKKMIRFRRFLEDIGISASQAQFLIEARKKLKKDQLAKLRFMKANQFKELVQFIKKRPVDVDRLIDRLVVDEQAIMNETAVKFRERLHGMY